MFDVKAMAGQRSLSTNNAQKGLSSDTILKQLLKSIHICALGFHRTNMRERVKLMAESHKVKNVVYACSRLSLK